MSVAHFSNKYTRYPITAKHASPTSHLMQDRQVHSSSERRWRGVVPTAVCLGLAGVAARAGAGDADAGIGAGAGAACSTSMRKWLVHIRMAAMCGDEALGVRFERARGARLEGLRVSVAEAGAGTGAAAGDAATDTPNAF